jgi:DNA polymerase V
MKTRNIATALDFTAPQHEAWIKKEMGVLGMRLKYELEGKSVLDLEIVAPKKRALLLPEVFLNKLRSLIY